FPSTPVVLPQWVPAHPRRTVFGSLQHTDQLQEFALTGPLIRERRNKSAALGAPGADKWRCRRRGGRETAWDSPDKSAVWPGTGHCSLDTRLLPGSKPDCSQDLRTVLASRLQADVGRKDRYYLNPYLEPADEANSLPKTNVVSAPAVKAGMCGESLSVGGTANHMCESLSVRKHGLMAKWSCVYRMMKKTRPMLDRAKAVFLRRELGFEPGNFLAVRPMTNGGMCINLTHGVHSGFALGLEEVQAAQRTDPSSHRTPFEPFTFSTNATRLAPARDIPYMSVRRHGSDNVSGRSQNSHRRLRSEVKLNLRAVGETLPRPQRPLPATPSHSTVNLPSNCRLCGQESRQNLTHARRDRNGNYLVSFSDRTGLSTVAKVRFSFKTEPAVRSSTAIQLQVLPAAVGFRTMYRRTGIGCDSKSRDRVVQQCDF
ncbi:hypothetical protein Bbelb_438750, partial [Branchiostoma belcheri]